LGDWHERTFQRPRQNLSLDYGRSPKGERVNDEKPTAHGETVSTAAVLTEHGIKAECMGWQTML